MSNKHFICLGIESSCDETACAVVRDGKEVLANLVSSQTDLHSIYGGVVPEIACRAHEEVIIPMIDRALEQSGLALSDITAAAVTNTPGLIGALLVGISAAKAVSFVYNIPLIGINHIYSHLYAANLHFDAVEYPAIGFVISGGHTSLFYSTSPTEHKLIGATQDDAAGEAFDKAAKIMKLPYPGGPAIEKTALTGNPKAVRFPRSLLKNGSLDFSFSGIKTAVLYHCKGMNGALEGPDVYKESREDLAASFQEAVVDTLAAKLEMAVRRYNPKGIIIGGGVAANKRLREKINLLGSRLALKVYIPPIALCTDNAAVTAGLAYHYWRENKMADMSLDAVPLNMDVSLG
ncbi:MAG: tRNA (adenosine(37)-N6)-threonylcarbamoyltransferase complex transferase subunit TsaD [Planctomycetes bacterium]|nr:tRNA (adenosine(37)-N6)-threonylcarbamoyltransferase complex transferase subunit TsaD [Planctomycetota bacterium]